VGIDLVELYFSKERKRVQCGGKEKKKERGEPGSEPVSRTEKRKDGDPRHILFVRKGQGAGKKGKRRGGCLSIVGRGGWKSRGRLLFEMGGMLSPYLLRGEGVRKKHAICLSFPCSQRRGEQKLPSSVREWAALTLSACLGVRKRRERLDGDYFWRERGRGERGLLALAKAKIES